MQIYWSAVFNFFSLFHYLIIQSFVVLSYTVRYMNVLADGFKVASSTLYLGEFHAMQSYASALVLQWLLVAPWFGRMQYGLSSRVEVSCLFLC